MAEIRRTQAQRRAETSRALIDATIDTIVEKGYAQVSVKEICLRAGVSHGGLFGRFSTLFDLVAAAAAEVGVRQREQFVAKMVELPDRSDVRALLTVWRDVARDPINAVWRELIVAARTDAALREKLAVVRYDYGAAMLADGVKNPVLEGLSQEQAFALGSMVLFCLDGDAINAGPFPEPQFEQSRLDALTTMVNGYLASHRETRP
ncbi:TetR/AcrR family transcriptional regulator [Nocardia sp. NPDC058480]|uniref:TetR/AcrR family transcriptional regulator n=1 Tax=unclassified Nocardia TaxID=2637762 RepID=UPI003658853B